MPVSLFCYGWRMLSRRSDIARSRQADGRECRLLVLLVAPLLVIASLVSPAQAGEPGREFVARLRTAGLFDMAIAYLDRVDRMPSLPAEFVEAVPLEKAQTYIDAAVAARTASDRDSFFVSAEEELKKFLQASDHPRLSEARLQLGKLQMLRARQLVVAGDPDDETRAAARESYLAASTTFQQIETRLRGLLEEMKGQRIDAAKEPEKALLRDQYRFEFLQALSLGAESKQLAAETHRDPAGEGKQLLEAALTTFTELSDKYGGYLQGAQALLNRGQIQRRLGQNAEALDSLLRVIEQPDIPQLRPVRLRAMTALLEIRLADEPPKIDEAIGQAKPLVDAARPDERRSAEFAELQVTLAKAYFALSDKAAADGKAAEAKRTRSSMARPLLASAVKIPGPHEPVAREMLAALGFEPDEPTAQPEFTRPTSLEEAVARTQELLQLNEELAKTRPLLTQRAEAGGQEGTDAAQELELLDQRIAEGHAVIVELLRSALTLKERDPELLHRAHLFLAYSLFQRGEIWEAAAVGGYLSRTAPGRTEGLRGGLIALTSLQNLAQELPSESKPGVVRQIESLGEHLIRSWPNDRQAAAAQGVMIRLALDDDRWEDARQLILRMPEGEERLGHQRLMGQLLWNRSLILRQENRSEEADELLPEAATELRAGLAGLPGPVTAAEPIQAALVLAKVELRRGDPTAALAALDDPKFGPITMLETVTEPSENFRSDLHSVELQAVVGVMTAGGDDGGELLNRATEVMERLRASVADKPDANDRLTRIFLGLARDIRDQLDAADPARKAKLVTAFKVFLDSIADSTEEPTTLQWVGQTLLQLGESSMGQQDVRAQGQAAELLASATRTLENLLGRLGDETPATLKYQLARAFRLSGEYKKAIDLFEEILGKTPMMIDAQIEAARSYEQWAGTLEPQFATRSFEFALMGARKDADGKNVIWGWGRISRLLSGKAEFRDTFFEARYHIALCRFMMGKTSQENKLIEQAVADIKQVAALYPELGGPQRQRDFDLLLKEIQKALGKPPEGLSAIMPPPK